MSTVECCAADGRSLMNKRNKMGPKMLPCGTPDNTVQGRNDSHWCVHTVCVHLDNCVVSPARYHVPHRLSISLRADRGLWGKKPFIVNKHKPLCSVPVQVKEQLIDSADKSAVSVEWNLRKPDWNLCSRTFKNAWNSWEVGCWRRSSQFHSILMSRKNNGASYSLDVSPSKYSALFALRQSRVNSMTFQTIDWDMQIFQESEFRLVTNSKDTCNLNEIHISYSTQ